VSTEKQIDYDAYSLIITRRNGSELLCFPDGLRYSLPSVDIPRWQRVAEQIDNAVKERWNLDVYSLSTFLCGKPTETVSPIQFQLMECIRPNGHVPHLAQWIPLTSLTDSSFWDSRILPNIHVALGQFGTQANKPCMRPFATAGWLRDLCLWIQEKIDPMNLRLSGQFRQLTASPTFNLIRFETNGPALWFKAVGEPNLHELRIVSTLAALFPSFLPRIIASLPERNAWLMAEAEGTSPDADSNFSTWKTLSARLADLQIASLREVPCLISAGCRDTTVSSLFNSTDEFFTIMDKLMEQQVKTPPSILTSEELLDLKKRIKEILSSLAACGIPDTLNHLDFNPGNIFVSGERCTFIDWAEAAIGHPFLTFQYLLEHLTRLRPDHADRREELVSAYASMWQHFARSSAVSHSLALAPVVAVFAYAVSTGTWREPEEFDSPRAAGYFRSLVRRMKREADALENRSFQCTRV
jgi:aminoglycoside phosphotransferase (APT) family kinase protein